MELDIGWKYRRACEQVMRRKKSREGKERRNKSSMQKAKLRLLLLYSISMGIILTVALFSVYMISQKEREQNKKRLFQNLVTSVYMKISTDSSITNSWLSEMESNNEAILQIYDGDTSLQSWGSWITEEQRVTEVDKVEEKAQEDRFIIHTRPTSMKEGSYRIYPLKNDKGKTYYASACIVPYGNSFRSAIVVQYYSKQEQAATHLWRMFLGIEGIGIISMVFLNLIYVRFIMRPVEENKKMQTEFLAAASHELKAPLAVIRTSSSAIVRKPEKMQHYVDIIGEECVRMAGLVDDLLILSSTETKSWRMRMEKIELDTLLLDTYEEFQPICKEAKMELQIHLPEELLPAVRGDAKRLKQVLFILLNNAVQYAQSKEPICLQAEISKHYLFIRVVDHGIGIADEKKNAVFEKFYQVDSSHHDRKHYGLGLSIARELVQLHQGLLLLTDTPKGGCTFTIKLPIDYTG
ncbi:sensor histidine kinase [Anaerosporobacter faecicola]|uniref:sensor histidine kinase n=1 Tax=Anaerosporobacter faecicola TaxID=2718714 RepID=UPI00143BB644|nr:HAMP domain-containing sensor histidine kinase [Anaerosporobacter faecicola]